MSHKTYTRLYYGVPLLVLLLVFATLGLVEMGKNRAEASEREQFRSELLDAMLCDGGDLGGCLRHYDNLRNDR